MEEERQDQIHHSEEETTPEEPVEITSTPSFEDQVDALKGEVDESNKARDQFMDTLQRVQADFVNYKRRTEEEREEQQKYSNSRLILKLLPVLDDFNLAIDHASSSEADSSWLEGVKLIDRKLYSLLESENVTRIEAYGREFDPFEHEAIAYQESSEHQDGQILTVVRNGYKLHGRVLRPTQVILAKKLEDVEEESSAYTEKETEDA